MSLCARKRDSRDPKEESHYVRRNFKENEWTESRKDFNRKQHCWHSEGSDACRSKWSTTGRDRRRSENVYEYHAKAFNTSSRWDHDEAYGSQMSPRFYEWRFQNRFHSPKDNWRRSKRSRSHSLSRSRSRSRSLSRSRRRSRSRSSFLRGYATHDNTKATLCRNFASGRCSRGDQCWFVHDDYQIQENKFERYQKNHRTGDDSMERKYKRGDTSDPQLSNERRKDQSLDRISERDYHLPSEIPCKFFAVGKCRNGTDCRFSHSEREDRGHRHSLRQYRDLSEKDKSTHKARGYEGLSPEWNHRLGSSNASKKKVDASMSLLSSDGNGGNGISGNILQLEASNDCGSFNIASTPQSSRDNGKTFSQKSPEKMKLFPYQKVIPNKSLAHEIRTNQNEAKSLPGSQKIDSPIYQKPENFPNSESEMFMKEKRLIIENGSPENLDNGSKKNKDDGKAMRSFKFALARFVKNLMKPKWKEGVMSKESYKLILKKVIYKVTHAMNSSNIPQTQQKIDHYLSVSKPKLAKLVQAYVEKSQKEN